MGKVVRKYRKGIVISENLILHDKKELSFDRTKRVHDYHVAKRSSGEKARSVSMKGRNQMNVDEFKRWLMKFDSDKDGRISRKELQAAIRSCGVWFSTRKSTHGMSEADVNGSGYIDEHEIDDLVDFAEKNMGFKLYY